MALRSSQRRDYNSISSGPVMSDSEPDTPREFTFQAVFIGLLIGCLLCFANLSFGLQTGWISMMSLQSALIGFLISRLLPIPLSAQEIIVVQTTAVATGTMPLAAGFVGIIPALTLLDEVRDGSLPSISLGLLPLDGAVRLHFSGEFQQLAFPSGILLAAATSITQLTP
ncbi:OPT oligopeptide transporter protein-domain-containing protein [Mycena leptocephala]|nr:OPT oligopeptide transporter protein-domain-containing protein [Mycena leptocephala]